MSFTIQDFISQQIFPNIKLLAGRKGCENEISWVNFMEILDSPESVQPGELLFTTGYGFQDEGQYHNLIPLLSKRGISGIVIQLGYYLVGIPPYLLSQADQLGLPLLTLPKDVTFSEILHTMMQIISPDQQQGWGDSNLKQAYSFLEQNLVQHSKDFFPDQGDQCIQLLLLEPVNYTRADESTWNECLAQIRSFIQSNSNSCVWRELPQHKYIFLTTHPPANCLPMLYSLNIKFTLLSEQFGTNYYLGAEYINSLDNLYVMLEHASEALNTLRLIQARRGVCPYNNIKFIKMLGQLHRKDSSVVLDNQALQLLLNYDKINKSTYVQTLRVYLSNSCNVTQTASQLFVHRHTLLKRLAKIASIGGLDLEDYYTRVYMSIALLFHDYFIY